MQDCGGRVQALGWAGDFHQIVCCAVGRAGLSIIGDETLSVPRV